MLAEVFHRRTEKPFDRASLFPYTSLFVRDVTNLSGAALELLEPFSWKGMIFGPGTL
jgi:hypothetical protein